jgi:hypothetical protein
MWSGANIEEMTRLADELDAGAQMIAASIGEMENSFYAMWWKGQDAERFATEWDGQHAPGLRALSESCRAEAVEVRRQRDQQIAVAAAAEVAAHARAQSQAAAEAASRSQLSQTPDSQGGTQPDSRVESKADSGVVYVAGAP